MKADILEYTVLEGGPWLPWPFKTYKPSNVELETITTDDTTGATMFWDIHLGIAIRVHSMKLSDGREWDAVNGFRDGENESDCY